jgi:hypothetical protein
LEKKEQAEFRVDALPDYMMGVYTYSKDEIIVDLKQLREYVEEYVEMAKEFYPDMNEEEVFVAKFTSLVSHELIHRTLHLLFDKEVSHRFDRLSFMGASEFMEKLPPNSISMLLWEDALETNPIGDTWFGFG